ncbi:MAG: aryl-sulfate sulfotransferase [Pirellulales bacterium]|nr:aryl-sulfate sulfotransferase [Pirellulales bacterium]
MNSTTTYLINMKGHVVNRWQSEFTPGASAYLLENGHLLRTGAEHGGSLRGAAAGGRIQEFSWDGELLWDYSLSNERHRPHHDICPMPNGNVLVIVWDKKTPEEAIAAGRIAETVRGQFLADCIFEVKPSGKKSGEIIWKWYAWDHLIQDVDETKPNYGEVSEHPELIDINFGTNVMASMIKDPKQLAKLRALGYVGGGWDADRDRGRSGGPGAPGPRGGPHMSPDWMHTNSIAYNDELDQIMLSIHEFSEVWIIDHSTTTEEAASHRGGRYGKGGDLLYRWGNPRAYRNGTKTDQRLFAQHCANWIPKGLPGEGHMLVFNNGNRRPDGSYSSVDEVVLPIDKDGHYLREEYLAFGPEKAVWSYSEPKQGSFFSMNISGAQRLPNGNTFICSGAAGVLFEVTPEKEVVWKYSTPQHGPGGPGGPGGPRGMRPGELFPSFLQDMLRMNDQQKAQLSKLQKEVKAELAKLLTEKQRDQLEKPMSFGFGGPPPGRNPNDRQEAIPTGDRRGPGGPGRSGAPFRFTPPRPGEVIPSMFVESLELTKEQILKLKKLQMRVDDQISEILTKSQKSQLDEMQRMFTRGPGAGPPGFGPPGFGPPQRDGDRPDRVKRPDGQQTLGDRNHPRGFGGTDRLSSSDRDHNTGRPGPGNRPGRGPGGPGLGPGGIFTCYRYGPHFPGLVGKDIMAGREFIDILGGQDKPRPAEKPR